MPLISVITPLFNPEMKTLKQCLESAVAPDVEHILVLDGVSNIRNVRALRRMANRHGARLEIIPKHVGISAASNRGVEIASGEILVFLDQDDLLEEKWFRPMIVAFENADFVYSDAYMGDERGRAVSTLRKPDWSPIRLIFNMYAVHFMAIRKTTFKQAGGFRSEFDGAQDHDLALRVSRISAKARHIRSPLYTWRKGSKSTAGNASNKTWAYEAGVRAAQDHLNVLAPGSEAKTVSGYPGALKVNFPPRELPVSIVIPTGFKTNLCSEFYYEMLLKSLLPYIDAEIGDEVIIVHGGEVSSESIENVSLALPVRVSSVIDSSQFNFSRRVNIGFSRAVNEHVLLLNDDMYFGTENPLDQLFGFLGLPNVGLVGGLLVFPDFSIQHGGHVFVDGIPTHLGYGESSLEVGLYDLVVDREASGVTGALMFQLKSTWQAVGGFSTTLPLAFNDVDYCLKVRSVGYSIVQANSVTAFHYESSTRNPGTEQWELDFLQYRWRDALSDDGYSAPYT